MRRTVLVSSAMAMIYFSSLGQFTACGQIGGDSAPSARPGSAKPEAPSPTAPGTATAPGASRFEPSSGSATAPETGAAAPSRFGSGAASDSTGPGAGGTFQPLPENPPTTIPPTTTPPPVRAPGSLGGDSSLPGTTTAPEAGGLPRFGAPPATDGGLPPATAPGLAPSTLDDPAFAPTEPALPESRYGTPADPLGDRGALPAEGGLAPLDDERMLPGAAAPSLAPGGAAPLPEPGVAAPPAERRLAKMVYRNELATFFLVFDQGSAHYLLQHGQPAPPQPVVCLDGHCPLGPGVSPPNYVPHLATLRLEDSSDPNYWHYTARDGDEFTAEWAFARRPSRDGGYAVYRQTRSGWARYGSFTRRVLR